MSIPTTIEKNLAQNSIFFEFWSRFLIKILGKAFGIELEEIAAKQDANATQDLRVNAVAVEDAVAGHATRA